MWNLKFWTQWALVVAKTSATYAARGAPVTLADSHSSTYSEPRTEFSLLLLQSFLQSTVEGHGYSTNTVLILVLPYMREEKKTMKKSNRLYFFAALFLGLVGGVAKAGPIKGETLR